MNHPKETNNLLKTEKDQKIKERKEEPSELDHTYVSDRVPQPFVQLVKCFFPEAKTIEEYWKMAHIVASSYRWELDSADILESIRKRGSFFAKVRILFAKLYDLFAKRHHLFE
jgi:hypothetical protein